MSDKYELKRITKSALTVEVEEELLKRVKIEAKKRGFKLRQIVEYGFNKFLESLEKEGESD